MSSGGPMAGRAIADAAWSTYTAVTERWHRGEATVAELRTARLRFDAAQSAVEQAAERESRHWRRSTR